MRLMQQKAQNPEKKLPKNFKKSWKKEGGGIQNFVS